MIPLPELKVAMKVGHDAENSFILDLEAAAVAFVQNETGRYFGVSGSATEYVKGSGTSDLWLAEPPASLPATVLERAHAGADSVTITAANSDGYVLRDRMKLVRKGGSTWSRGYEYEVTYTRGYAAGQEPADIRTLVTLLVTHWYENRVPVADSNVTTAPPLPLHAQNILARWRRRPWA